MRRWVDGEHDGRSVRPEVLKHARGVFRGYIIAPDGVTLSYGSAADIGSANAVLDQYPDTLYETFFGAAVR